MGNKFCIEHLNNLLANLSLTIEEKAALEYAIKKLKNNNNRETLIEVAKIVAAILNAGTKFLDP